jgi:uncharacterized protein with ParB-like and HNH nuclease domain
MEDVFKPESQTIIKLFSNQDSKYQIPDYQRPYSWTDEQVEQLWDDIKSAFDNNQSDNSQDTNYFLGSIITVPGDRGYQDVIDGQQRITTLMILFCVIRDLFPNINSDVNFDDVPEAITTSNIKRCIWDDNDRKRLTFLTAPADQNDFESAIININTSTLKKPTQREIKLSPKNKFRNTATIFRDKLQTINAEDKSKIGKLVNYIFNSVRIIKITCTTKSFAIKLFQSLNATGLDLAPTDLLKSFLMSRLNEERSKQFVSDWSKLEHISRDTDFKDMGEVFTSYLFYRLASNPRKSLNDELESVLKDEDPNTSINDIKQFAEIYKDKILEDENKLIYSLRYLRWSIHWKTILTTALKENYSGFPTLLFELRRFYYLYWIAGKSLTHIKQTSFNTIKAIKDGASIDQIKSDLRKKTDVEKIIDRVKENLQNAVYGEPWLKPLLLLVEYKQTDASGSHFIEMASNLHTEHIIPIQFGQFEEWSHISAETFEKIGNTLGNMTLLSGAKNIEASNNPFRIKIDVYKGNGKNKTKKDGVTGFKITQKIIADATVINKTPCWTESEHTKRFNWFCDEISLLFDIDLKDINA